MQQKFFFILSSLSFFIAVLFCAFYNEWIIISIPRNHKNNSLVESSLYKKEVTLYYHRHGKWNSEKQELLWSQSTSKNAEHLTNAWLTLLDEEGITQKKITLQTALLSHSGTLYLSFDHYPFTKEDTIFKKWMFIEGLLKTIHLHDIKPHSVQFLIQHEPLVDYHLDFSMPWPTQGFIK